MNLLEALSSPSFFDTIQPKKETKKDTDILSKEKEIVKKIFTCNKCQGIPKLIYKGKGMVEEKCLCNNRKTFNITMDEFMKNSNQIKNYQCKFDKSKNAKSYCVDCKGWLCENCVDNHRKFPALKNHNLSTKNLIINNQCVKCSSFKPTYFCNECQFYFCHSCIKNHKEHKATYLSSQNNEIIFKKAVEEFGLIQKQFDKLLNLKVKIIEYIQKIFNEYNQEYTYYVNFMKVLINTYLFLGKNTSDFNMINNLENNKMNIYTELEGINNNDRIQMKTIEIFINCIKGDKNNPSKYITINSNKEENNINNNPFNNDIKYDDINSPIPIPINNPNLSKVSNDLNDFNFNYNMNQESNFYGDNIYDDSNLWNESEISFPKYDDKLIQNQSQNQMNDNIMVYTNTSNKKESLYSLNNMSNMSEIENNINYKQPTKTKKNKKRNNSGSYKRKPLDLNDL